MSLQEVWVCQHGATANCAHTVTSSPVVSHECSHVVLTVKNGSGSQSDRMQVWWDGAAAVNCLCDAILKQGDYMRANGSINGGQHIQAFATRARIRVSFSASL